MNPPDKRQDDILFGDQWKDHGDRDTLAGLMKVDNAQVTLQLDPDNRVRSYHHCGKLALFAAYAKDRMSGGHRGETLWQDYVRTREAWIGAQALRAAESAGDMEIKRLCDNLTTAILATDEAAKFSAMTMLNAVLSARLSQRMSPAEINRVVNICSG